MIGGYLVCNSLDTLAAHYPTYTTNNQQNNVVQHLGICLIDRGHALDWLGYKGNRVQHEPDNTREDDSYDQDYSSPYPNFNLFTCQQAVEVVVVVGQLASPEQGLQDNQSIVA